MRHSTFSQWLQQYQPLLMKIVRAYAQTMEDREDLYQEISIQVWDSIPRFEGRSAVSTWLYRIAINTALRWKSKTKKHGNHQPLETHGHFMEKAPLEDERVNWLYEQIGKLNDVDKSLAILLLDGYSYREMSDIIGITESNIGVKIHRIKKVLIASSKNYAYDGI